MAAFRSFKMGLVAWVLAISLFSGSGSASKSFVGLGPIFSSSALGYLSGGMEFSLNQWGDFSLSAGPWVGLFFGSSVIGSDIDGMLKGYYHIQLNNKFSLGITAKLPVGLTLASVNIEILGRYFQPGFNIGLIPGVEFHFHPNFGVFAELGFLHHSLFPTAKDLPNNHYPLGFFSAGAIFKF